METSTRSRRIAGEEDDRSIKDKALSARARCALARLERLRHGTHQPRITTGRASVLWERRLRQRPHLHAGSHLRPRRAAACAKQREQYAEQRE